MFQGEKGITRWRQIAETLGRDVSQGRFSEGRLPPEPELAERFGVNRHTIRRAIGALADQGFVRVEQGRGTFVAEQHIDYVLGRRTRFSANLQRRGYEPGYRLITISQKSAEGTVATDLEIAAGTPIIEMETVGEADSVPLNYALHRFPAERFANLPAAFAETHSITAALAACGVADYTRRLTRFLARLPSEHEAAYLQQPLSRPVLQSEATNIDISGRPIQSSLTVFAGDRVQITIAADSMES